jgi:hydroxymethylbilane synthase
LAKVGIKGMFTKEIEEALADRRVDLAVHSLKDLPTEIAPEFAIPAITTREDPRDAFVAKHYARFTDLPQHARVGTSSLRRQAQLKALRPDLEIFPLRGNVDTRLRKMETGEFEAVILAHAGLRRLGRTEFVREVLPVEVMCPAVGQGALAIEMRAGDPLAADLQFLNSSEARAATFCERALLNQLGGGCQVPIGGFAEVERSRLRLTAVVARPDGSRILRESQSGDDPEQLGIAVGQALLRRGGDQILREVYGHAAAAPQQP